MAKKKKKISSVASVVIIAAIGIFAAHFLGIFTFEDWKKLFSDSKIPAEETAYVHYIDVGQGDCELIISGNESLLIDTGEREYSGEVCDYLKEQGIDKITYMLLSHQHSDHMGGAADIINTIEVENVIIPRLPEDMTPTTKTYESFLLAIQENGLQLTAARPGDVYKFGECSMEIISPLEEYDDLNNFSAVVLVTHGVNSFLFTGDIEKEAEEDIIDSGRLEDIDVYKAAHHGSNSSNTKDFLKEIKPEYAVISCGAGNSYGHPHQKALDRISEYAEYIYRTDIDGSIVFTSTEDNISVKTENEE